jgi:hypothetical protein
MMHINVLVEKHARRNEVPPIKAPLCVNSAVRQQASQGNAVRQHILWFCVRVLSAWG